MATNNTSLLTQKDETVNKWAQKNPHGMTNVNSNIYNFDINKEKENYLRYGYNSADDMYNAYNNDLNFVRRVDELDVAKQEQMDAAKKAESQKLQYVDTRRQLMEKYIPETLLAQGVANTGYTADALLKAENNYNQFAHGAMTERANTEQNALKDYQDAYALAQKERDQTAYENFVNANEKQTALYNDAIGRIKDESSEWTMDELKALLTENGANEDTIAKVEKYYDELKRNAQNDVYKELMQQVADGTINYTDISKAERDNAISPEQAAAIKDKLNIKENNDYYIESAVNGKKKGINGEDDVFKVDIGINTYKLKTGESIWNPTYTYGGKTLGDGEYSAEDRAVWNMILRARENRSTAYPKGTLFVYNGKMYVVDDDNENKIYAVSNVKDYDEALASISGKYDE